MMAGSWVSIKVLHCSSIEAPRRLPRVWRPSQSDSEDVDEGFRYRKIRPELTQKKGRQRKDSPPCPHEWESHEDIAKMQEMLRKPKAHRQGVSIHVATSLESESHTERIRLEEEKR